MPSPEFKTTRLGVCVLVALALVLTSQQSFAFRWRSWLSPSDSHIDFGGLKVGVSATLPEVLTNNGYYPVTVSSATVSGGPFAVQGPSLPLTLDPGASITFNVVFAPTDNSDFSGTLSVTWGRYGRSLNIPVTATGTGTGSLSAAPATIGFGNVAVGSSLTKTAALTASGDSTVVSSVTTTNPEFTVSGVTLPLTLEPGQSASFTVKFTPQSSGAAAASLSFVSAGLGALASEALSGTGTAVVQHSVGLSWTESASDIAGYNIYRAATSGGPYSKVNSDLDDGVSYSDSDVNNGQTYFYVVTSVDADGTESNYTGEVAATIPAS